MSYRIQYYNTINGQNIIKHNIFDVKDERDHPEEVFIIMKEGPHINNKEIRSCRLIIFF